jgi:hypothetical protein
MISTARTETVTRYFETAGSPTPERTVTETRHTFSGKGHLSLTSSCIEFVAPYGDADRQLLSVWLDNGEVADAVESWLASLQRTATDDSCPRLQAVATEKLQRFAGAMGLTYPTAAPVVAG